MTATVAQTFPHYREVVQELVDEHLELEDQPLLLALYYASESKPNDIFLFEVADRFGGNYISEELMEVTFGAASGLRIGEDQRLHLIITNPYEFDSAVETSWPGLQEIRQAIINGQYKVLYTDPSNGERLLDALRK